MDLLSFLGTDSDLNDEARWWGRLMFVLSCERGGRSSQSVWSGQEMGAHQSRGASSKTSNNQVRHDIDIFVLNVWMHLFSLINLIYVFDFIILFTICIYSPDMTGDMIVAWCDCASSCRIHGFAPE